MPTPFTIEGSTLLLPVQDSDGTTAVSADVRADGTRAVVTADGRLLINGMAYDGGGKHIRQRYVTVSWSPDGRWLAYAVQTPGAEQGVLDFLTTIDDGVWVLDTQSPGAQPVQVFRNTYFRASNVAPYRIATSIAWANDNYAMLITVQTVAGPAIVLAGVRGERQYFDNTSATWLPDSSGWVTTTLPGPNGVELRVVDRNGKPTSILSGAMVGLWMQYPAQTADGRYAFLGKPAANGLTATPASSLQLYIYTPGGIPVGVSDPLDGDVISAEWNPARTAVLVVLRMTRGVETKVVTLDGRIVDYTDAARGLPGARWQ